MTRITRLIGTAVVIGVLWAGPVTNAAAQARFHLTSYQRNSFSKGFPATETAGSLNPAGLSGCGRYSGPVGQAQATTKPVIAHAVPWGLSPLNSIRQAAAHGITGFSIDSSAPNIFPQILRCSNNMWNQGIHFASAVLLNVDPASANKQSLHHEVAYIIRHYMSDEAYLHISLGGKSRPVLFIYYGANESDDPTFLRTLNWLRGTTGTKNVVFLADPGPDCRVGTPTLTTAQMLSHIDGIYIDDNCNANSQAVMSSDIRTWNQQHDSGQQRAWFASARADAGLYAGNWNVATGTNPIAVTICSWNNPAYPDVAGNQALLHITSVKSKAWRG